MSTAYAPVLAQREKLAAHLIKQLGLRRMAASYCPTAQAAKAELLGLIPSPASVIRCGSESVGGLGLWDDSSANALTLDGRLVNLDGTSNRVAGMLFGPRKVLLLVGMNKVVADLEAAYARVRSIAAPANNIRLAGLGLKNPCIEDGRCHNCRSETRICNSWVVIEGSSVKDRIHVVLVGEDLGY